MDGITLIHQEICVFKDFPAKHAMTTVSFGDCSFRQGLINEEIQLMRLMAFTKADCAIKIVPEHKDNLALVIPYPENKISRYKCDALISFKLKDDFNPMLASCTADCPTVFLTDKNGSFIGLVHSGWAGTALKIVEKTINKVLCIGEMINNKEGIKLDICRENILAAVWPGICHQHFEVGPEFKAKFPGYFKPSSNGKGKGHISLNDVIIDQLLDCGIDPGNITELKTCSFHTVDPSGNPIFHSYRRESNGLRNMGVIAL